MERPYVSVVKIAKFITETRSIHTLFRDVMVPAVTIILRTLSFLLSFVHRYMIQWATDFLLFCFHKPQTHNKLEMRAIF